MRKQNKIYFNICEVENGFKIKLRISKGINSLDEDQCFTFIAPTFGDVLSIANKEYLYFLNNLQNNLGNDF